MDTNASLRSFSIIFWYQKNIFLSLLLRFFSFSEQCRNLNFYVQGVHVLTRPIAISRVPREQRPTDRRTDRRTDRVAYRVACTRLKKWICAQGNSTPWPISISYFFSPVLTANLLSNPDLLVFYNDEEKKIL